VAGTEDADGFYTCERCGKRKLVGSRCASCGEGHGDPLVPQGWDPSLTSSDRPRLNIVARPEAGDDRPEQSRGEGHGAGQGRPGQGG
jgi:ribosomal protein L37E